MRYELSHFELDDETYRFDFYRTTDNEIRWGKNCGRLSEFDIDYNHTSMGYIAEKKPYNFRGLNMEAYYYPGFIFEFKTVRNPGPTVVRVFFPCILLAAFMCACYRIERNAYEDRLS